jgi:hypothetical protein
MTELKNLVHFYHVFADGYWQDAAADHFKALETSGLMGQLDDVFLGIVGQPENRRAVKRELPGVVVAEDVEGWEQVTLRKLHTWAKQNTAKVFYAHTKGAWSNSNFATQWRLSMTEDTVTRWQECVKGLDEAQCVGPFWISSVDERHAGHKYFFAGNFWWARTDYLATLPRLKNEHRFQAEGWIGLKDPKIINLGKDEPAWEAFWRRNGRA